MHPQRYSLHSLFHAFLAPSYLLVVYILLRIASSSPRARPGPQFTPSSPPLSLTVYLALSPLSTPDFHVLLRPFTTEPTIYVQQLIIFCSESFLPELDSRLSQFIEQNHASLQTSLVLKPVKLANNVRSEILINAAQAVTDWVLILDDKLVIDDFSSAALLALWDDIVFASPFPDIYDFSSPSPYLNITLPQTPFQFWQNLHTREPPLLLPTSVLRTERFPRLNLDNPSLFGSQIINESIVFLFPNFQSLRSASKMVCGFLSKGYSSQVFIYDRPRLLTSTSWQSVNHDLCRHGSLIVQENTNAEGHAKGIRPALLSWLDHLAANSKVLFSVIEDKPILEGLLSMHALNLTRIYIPEEQYFHTDWIGSLSIEELQHWYTPRFTFTIATFNRPESFRRLLDSLSSSLYFGDSNLDIRITIEKEAGFETQRLAQTFKWLHGSMQIHQRIVHGGLLPAIVESWYPTDNNSYGLLLEDDVELSSLFYAWIKMTILKYRYSLESSHYAKLFGVSLYQQKTLELPSKGRQPFNARSLFSSQYSLNIPTNTPYLSPIPCSWGAIYFPEHWREFYAYLSSRLDKPKGTDQDPVVPSVRSNRWTHSWKRYFIELVYLRGYVMLYPNFADFVSLSTNHLEIGSHVQARSAMSPEKRDLFVLPLMQLPPVEETGVSTGLLDLPELQLPSWTDLPVLNLTGSITTLDSLAHTGRERAKEMGLL